MCRQAMIIWRQRQVKSQGRESIFLQTLHTHNSHDNPTTSYYPGQNLCHYSSKTYTNIYKNISSPWCFRPFSTHFPYNIHSSLILRGGGKLVLYAFSESWKKLFFFFHIWSGFLKINLLGDHKALSTYFSQTDEWCLKDHFKSGWYNFYRLKDVLKTKTS